MSENIEHLKWLQTVDNTVSIEILIDYLGECQKHGYTAIALGRFVEQYHNKNDVYGIHFQPIGKP